MTNQNRGRYVINLSIVYLAPQLFSCLSILPGGGVCQRRPGLPRRRAGVVRHAADGGGGAHREGDPDHQLALLHPARRRRQTLRHQRLQADVREHSELRQETQGGDEL